ncbi:hypothetical protein T01_9937 [Trichinella spiralis]|uniref:Uncharacterized protein n=1 Tax=Trichinella spiralis TaxID=6334 RepID=A0A0V1AWC3_TRISP|nr:hypothetical protein T01_9937 [Trichinella spiralis]
MVSVHGIPVTENSNIPFNKRLITALAECKEEVHTGFAGQLCRKLPSSSDINYARMPMTHLTHYGEFSFWVPYRSNAVQAMSKHPITQKDVKWGKWVRAKSEYPSLDG